MNSLTIPERTIDVVNPLFQRARDIYDKILAEEIALIRNRDRLLVLALGLGTVLVEMKEQIGHGKWLFWLDASWPQLGARNATRCMALVRDNPQAAAKLVRNGTEPTKSVDSADFTDESVRKFMWGYVPVKERAQLAGDESVAPHQHYLTFINQYSKWRRQIKIGHAELPALHLMRRDFEPTVRDLIELLGREWVYSLFTRG